MTELSYNQALMLRAHRRLPTLDIVARMARVRPPFSADAFVHALQHVAARHPLIGQATCRLVEADADVLGQAHRLALTPFELGHAAPLRAWLLRERGDSFVIVLSFHHTCVDAWSLGIFLSELLTVYAGAPLPPAPPPFSRWVAHERTLVDTPAGDRHCGYWLMQLDGADWSGVATRPTGDGVCAEVATTLDAARLSAEAAAHDATLFALLVAAFAKVLRASSRSDDLVIGTTVARRRIAELRSTVGPMFGYVPLRLRAEPDAALATLVARARRVVLEARAHEEYPFEALLPALGFGPEPDALPLSVLCVLQQPPPATAGGLAAFMSGAGGGALIAGSTRFESLALERRVTPFALFLSAAQTGPELGLRLVYNVEAVGAGRARAVLEAICRELRVSG